MELIIHQQLPADEVHREEHKRNASHLNEEKIKRLA